MVWRISSHLGIDAWITWPPTEKETEVDNGSFVDAKVEVVCKVEEWSKHTIPHLIILCRSWGPSSSHPGEVVL